MDPDIAEWVKAGTSDLIVFGGTAAVSTAALGAVNDEAALEILFDNAADQRAEIVKELTRQIKSGSYGIGDDNVLHGPSGFRIDLDDCPDGWSDTTGITRSEIRIGSSTPLSGILSRFGQVGTGMQNYFDWVNENDPVAGRQITLVTKDDGYVAQKTIEIVDALIDTENVFSIPTLGSPNILAVYDRLNSECIPQPFVVSGHPAWGDPVVHPRTTGLQLAYTTEATLWGTWIEQNLTDELPVKVAGLVMDNDFGVTYEAAFAAWADANPDVVSEFVAVRHDPAQTSVDDFADEMQTIADADPDLHISMTAGNACLSAIQLAGTNGLTDSIRSGGGVLFTSSVCREIDAWVKPAGSAADGWRIVGGGFKDITDPAVADEPFIRFARANLTASGLDPATWLHGWGYLFSYPYVEALRIAAELPGGLTRTNLILAIRALDIDHPLLLDGISFRLNGTADAYLVEGSETLQYDANSHTWETATEVIDIDGQTPNCVWTRGSLQDTDNRCGSPTRDCLTTLAARGVADVEAHTAVQAVAYRVDRDGPLPAHIFTVA